MITTTFIDCYRGEHPMIFPIKPFALSNSDLESVVRDRYRCPYCLVQTTSGNTDIGWIECPMRRNRNKWICGGCFEDIYSTCIDSTYCSNPYRELVEQAAMKEGLTASEYRVRCVEHQISLATSGSSQGGEHYPTLEYLLQLRKRLTEGMERG